MAADFEVADISLALISRGGGGGGVAGGGWWFGGSSILWGDLRQFWDGQLLCQHHFLAGCLSLYQHLAML